MTCYVNCANITIANCKIIISLQLCFFLCAFSLLSGQHTTQKRCHFPIPNLMIKLLSVYFPSVYFWLVTCLILALKFVDCITLRLHCYISIYLRQTTIVKYKLSWSFVLHEWEFFHSRFRFHLYSPIGSINLTTKQYNDFYFFKITNNHEIIHIQQTPTLKQTLSRKIFNEILE